MLAVMRSSRSVLFAVRCVTVEWQMSECYFFIFLAHTISFSTFLKKKNPFSNKPSKTKMCRYALPQLWNEILETWQNNWRKRWKVHITNRPEWKWHWSTVWATLETRTTYYIQCEQKLSRSYTSTPKRSAPILPSRWCFFYTMSQ